MCTRFQSSSTVVCSSPTLVRAKTIKHSQRKSGILLLSSTTLKASKDPPERKVLLYSLSVDTTSIKAKILSNKDCMTRAGFFFFCCFQMTACRKATISLPFTVKITYFSLFSKSQCFPYLTCQDVQKESFCVIF